MSEGNEAMSGCARVKHVGTYHDDELSPEERRDFELHLDQCEACAAELRKLRDISRLLEGVCVPGMPDAVRRRLYASANRMPERMALTLARQLTAAAAVVLIVCSGFVGIGFAERETPAQMPNAWELAAVQPNVEINAGDTQQLAQWIVRDLSVENGHD